MTRGLTVLHVDPERGFGGGEVQVLTLVRALDRRGVRSVLAVHPAGALAGAAAAEGMPTAPLPIAHHLDLRAGLGLRRLAARGAFDVVHFHTARAHAMAPLCRRRGVRLVVTRRMDYVPRGGPYARFLYNRAVDAVIAISRGVEQALVSAGVAPERVRVVPSGIDPERVAAPPGAREALRREWGVGEGDVVFLVPGALERRKGHDVLLRAAARLAGEGRRLRYVFCGDGTEAAALRHAAVGLGTAVHFAGFRRDVGACLAAADVAVLPSLKEGLGVAALEAMAAGLPGVASAVGGLVEAVADGETGLLVPPGDARALAAALDCLARDADLRARLGAAGPGRVAAEFSGARMAEGTLACYGGEPWR